MQFLKRRARRFLDHIEKKSILKTQCPQNFFCKSNWNLSLKEPTQFYINAFRFFHQHLSEELKQHRMYFCENGRGFGEDAFHAMWDALVQYLQITNFLEIGVFRGQSLSLVSLLQRKNEIKECVFGISPFLSAGDSVSIYDPHIDYYSDTLANFAKFNLETPTLLKAFSTDISAKHLIQSREWDAIYIDGNHDYCIAKEDWDLCASAVKSGGIIVLDDSALGTSYAPPSFAKAGHPGPSQVASEVNGQFFDEILRVGHNRVFQKRTTSIDLELV